MRAVVQVAYGPPERVLRVTDVDRPVPGADAVLVRVRASTVTRGGAIAVRGQEYRFTRLFTGLRRPRPPITGSEFAGDVEAVGPAVTSFRVGDAVFGLADAAHAEFVLVRERGVVAHKPSGLSYEDAAAVPDGSLLALTCLRPAHPLQGKHVVVYGAAGSIGTAAVQLLVHHFDAVVTAVCDAKDIGLVRTLGARDVLDRMRDDFTNAGITYDVVFDAVGRHSFRRCRRALKPDGVFITVDLGFLYHVPLLVLVTRVLGSRRAALGIGQYRQEDLLVVKGLIEAGKYRPVIDRTYTLDEVVDATRYVETGQKTGNVVLCVSEACSAERPMPAIGSRP
jgi:NADPH:quinone reductase-like Zn-dependent oxidoreductase